MGLTLEFLIGDALELTDVVQEGALDRFADPNLVKMRADFSLHIEPRDLDHLSRLFANVTGGGSLDLRSRLRVLVDEVDRGLLEVSDSWVSYVALVPDDSASAIAEAWAAKMREAYGDPQIEVTDAMKKSVASLIALCKFAKKESLGVVHIWML